MMRTFPRVFGLAGAILSTSFFGACSRSHDDRVTRDVLALRARTIPSDAKLLKFTEITRNSDGAAASWEIQLATDSATYEGWIASQLSSDFNRSRGIRQVPPIPGTIGNLRIRPAVV